MRMLAQPQGATAQRYSLTCDATPVAALRLPLFGPSTMTPLAGRRYQLRRTGVLRETFTLEAEVASDADTPSVRATQRDAFHRDYMVEAGERSLTLRMESPLRSGYLLLEDGRVVGALRPAGALRHGVVADLPDDLPLELGVFLVWVVLLLWRGRRITRA